MGFVGGDLPHFILFVGTCDQLAVGGEEHPIASAGWFHELGNLAI